MIFFSYQGQILLKASLYLLIYLSTYLSNSPFPALPHSFLFCLFFMAFFILHQSHINLFSRQDLERTPMLLALILPAFLPNCVHCQPPFSQLEAPTHETSTTSPQENIHKQIKTTHSINLFVFILSSFAPFSTSTATPYHKQ